MENIDSVATKWKNLRTSRTKCSFRGSNMSRLVTSPCLWGKLQNLCFSKGWFPNRFHRFAWQAWLFVTFSRVCKWCRKSFCAPVTFARFSEDDFHFSWHVQHFGRVHVHFAWQAQQFRRVVLRVFLLIALSGLRQVVTTCKSRGKRGASRECHFAWQVQYFVQIHCVWM